MHAIVIPAIFGFLIKLYLVYVNRFSLTKEKSVFTALLAACTLHSLCESIGFSLWAAGNDVSALYRLYYVLTTWFLCFMLLYALEVSVKAKWLGYAFMFGASIISFLLLFSDFLISGYVDNDGVLNSKKSEGYWIFKVYVFSLMIISLVSLLLKIFKSKEKKKSIFVLTALLAPFAVIVAVMVLIDMGYRVNSMAVIPIATTFMFLFIVLSENRHLLTDIKRSLPWSKEGIVAHKTAIEFEKRFRNEITRKEFKDEQEKLYLEYMLSKTSGNSIKELAKKTGEPTSTLYRLFEKHNITIK